MNVQLEWAITNRYCRQTSFAALSPTCGSYLHLICVIKLSLRKHFERVLKTSIRTVPVRKKICFTIRGPQRERQNIVRNLHCSLAQLQNSHRSKRRGGTVETTRVSLASRSVVTKVYLTSLVSVLYLTGSHRCCKVHYVNDTAGKHFWGEEQAFLPQSK